MSGDIKRGGEESERGVGNRVKEKGGGREVVLSYSSLLQFADHIRGSHQIDRFWSLKNWSCQL